MADDGYLVFVSHSSVDTWVAHRIAERIETDGGRVFLDVVDIEAGDEYDDEIRDALRSSVELVVLMTPTARESRNVWMEVGAMWYAEKRIVGILYGVPIGVVRADERMPQGFKKLQLIDINDTDKYLAQVGKRIAKRVME